MRFYDLILSNKSGQVYKPTATGSGFTLGAGGSTFTSFVNGKSNPAALNIEFDLPVFPWNTPQGGGFIRVWGVGLQMIGQAADLNGASFSLSAGMKPGLPLATAAASQAGLIAQGQIFQAFGNWQGVNQTLELIVQPSGLEPPQGISFSWAAGTSLGTAIETTLSQAFPAYKTSISISSALVQKADEAGSYESLAQFAQYLQEHTKAVGEPTYGDQYPGVLMTVTGNTIYIYDGTASTRTTQLAFQDLIGQPTWIDAATVNFKTVLRSDIAVGSQIKFPAGIAAPYALTSPEAAVPNAPSRNKTAFQGTFLVNEVHHFANFRQADADSWNTTFSAVVAPKNS